MASQNQSSSDSVVGCSSSSDDVVVHAVVPLSECPHLSQVNIVPENGVKASALCSNCSTSDEVWVCLTCYKGHCGRYVMGHAVQHWSDTNHAMALSLCDLSVWCYLCEAYVHNELLLPAKNSVYSSKFGVPMPTSKNSDSHSV